MEKPPDSRLPRIPWRLAPALLALYAGVIAVLSWPWLATASSRVLDHWDPPFHAWKLMFAARTLLSGHILPPGGNTNLYYPNTGAFFYEALHWPQAVFAAPLLAAGANPVLTYHVTLVFFWALSGVLFWAWLRALGLRRAGAVLGGLFFTILPYRMSYIVEFNMQLSFGLPLLLLAMTRFFQRPSFRYALLAAVAWWLQATSELYQAVFFLLAMPLLVVPLVARDPALLRSGRRFWLPFAAAAALCAALSLPFLLPYAQTLGDGTLTRSLDEMRQHAIEPFSYLQSKGRIRLLPNVRARYDEMSVYPTLALSLATLLALAVHVRRRPRASTVGGRLADGLLAGTGAIAVVLAVLSHAVPGNGLVAAFSAMALAVVLLTIPVLLRRGRSVPRAVAAGLGAAALFGIVMSFGPTIAISSTKSSAPNHLFELVRVLFPPLAGFRVVSRFAVFPVMALCAAAAVGVDAASHTLRNRPRALRAAAMALFLSAFVAESLPPKGFPRTRPIRDVSRSAVIASLDTLTEPYVLAIVPMGLRDLDSEHMLTIERHDRLGVWAWGGTFPSWTEKIEAALAAYRKGYPERAALLLRQPWPDVLVLEDRRPFPGIQPMSFADWFGPLAETIVEDADFRLMRILPPADDETEVVRLVRRDIALSRPVARFSLSSRSGPARIWLDLNSVPIGIWDVSAAPQTCSIGIPPGLLVPHFPQILRFHAENDTPFRVDAFRLENAPMPTPPDVPVASSYPPWLSTYLTLPADATPLDIRYPGGITLCGAMRRPDENPSGVFPLRLFLRFPENAHIVPNLALSPGFAQDGSILFQHPIRLRKTIDGNAFSFAHGNIISADLDLPIPELLRPGETYDLTLDVKNDTNYRINGRDADGHKIRHANLGLRWHVDTP